MIARLGRRAVLALALCAVACAGHSAGGPNGVSETDAVVTLDCPVSDAQVWINGRVVGLVADVRGGIALAPGVEHRLEVRHDQYHTHYARLRLDARERRALTIELAPVLP